MIALLERALPYALVAADDPLFRYEIRRIRWGQTAQQLINYSLVTLVVVHALILVLWGLFILAAPGRLIASTYAGFDTSGEFMGWLIVAGIGVSIILDFMSVIAALSSISGEISAGRWDFIRLSSVYWASRFPLASTIRQGRSSCPWCSCWRCGVCRRSFCFW